MDGVKVFVSCTGDDLADHARVVRDQIRTLRWVAVDHHDWSATGRPSVATCRERVRGCAVLVVLVAHRYGWVPSPEEGGDGERSITWLVVEEARAHGLEVLPFLLEDTAGWPVGIEDVLWTPQTQERLQRFEAMLRGRWPCGSFSTPESLAVGVRAALDVARARLEAEREVQTTVGPSAEGHGPLSSGRGRSRVGPGDPEVVRVFISYSHDSIEHRDRVLALAQRLREDGLDCQLDRFVVSPPEGWPRWTEQQVVGADFVLLVCTETFCRRFEGRETPGVGRGVAWEAGAVVQQLYDAGDRNERFVPVLLDGASEDNVPLRLRGPTRYRVDDEYEALYRHLTRQPEVTAAPLGPRRGLPAMPAAEVRSDGVETFAEGIRAEMRALRAERKARVVAGEPTVDLDERLLALRRELRDGPVLQPGDCLGHRFELVEPVGKGGFATVWKAFDEQTDELVAVKVLHGHHGDSRERIERFFRGARKMQALSHSGVVRVVEPQGEDRGFHYFVMEYVPGGDLRQAVKAGRVAESDIVPLIVAVGDALQHAHDRGLVHRDVKPENILLDADGRPKLTDFDLVRAMDSTGGTRTGALGTIVYAAPEAMQDAKRADSRADVYSLAMTAVFAWYGWDLPYRGVVYDRAAFLGALRCRADVRAVLRQAVAVNEAERFPSMAAFCAALSSAVRPSAPSLAPASVPPPWDPHASAPSGPAPLDAVGPRRAAGVSSAGGGLVVATPRTEGGAPAAGTERVHERTGVVFVYVPAGSFRMGAEDISSNEKPIHPVRLSAFWMGKYPVTNAEYARFLEAKPDHGKPAFWTDSKYNAARQPVVGVSWHDAVDYGHWAEAFLPAEAQWEYGCRAGTTTAYWSGDAEADLARVGWYSGNSDARLHAVGEKPGNPWGLHDLHGNVWEWCADEWVESYAGRAVGATVPAPPPLPIGRSGADRVFRGGSWNDDARKARSAYRVWRSPGSAWRHQGFRLVLPCSQLGVGS